MTQPSALSREQTEMQVMLCQGPHSTQIRDGAAALILATDAAQRATIAQQAQDIERLQTSYDADMKYYIEKLAAMTKERDAQEVQMNAVRYRAEQAEQQLAAMTTERDAVKQENHKLQQRIGYQRKNLARKYHGWAETKVSMYRAIEYLRSKAAGEAPLFGGGHTDGIIFDLNKQLATAQARVQELEGNHCADCCCARSWQALGITEYTGKSIAEHIAQLQATIAEREARIAELEAKL